MKYIISESQYSLLTESHEYNWVKRRANYDSMMKYINDAERDFPTLCDDFGDEFEYADNVIKYAVDYFLTTHEEVFLDEKYDEVSDLLVEMCKDWFGEYLFDIFRNTCSDEDNLNEDTKNIRPQWVIDWDATPRNERIKIIDERKVRIEKMLPRMVQYFETKLGDNLIKLVVGEKGVMFGNEHYSTKNILLKFYVKVGSSKLRHEITNDLNSFFNVDVERYGTPLNLEFYKIHWEQF